MTGQENTSHLIDAFVLVKGDAVDLFEQLSREIEAVHGRIRHIFLRRIIFASLPKDKIAALRKSSVIALLATDVIVEPLPPLLAADEFLDIIPIWNKLLRVKQDSAHNRVTDKDLSWDAEGHLPPDPPTQFKEMMREWENEMNKATDNKKKTPGKRKV
jgi:phenylalanine-4-hydroxylase